MKYAKAGLMMVILLAAIPFANACQINIVAVNFGSFDNLNNPLDANGLVSIQCPAPTLVTIQLDAGSHSNGIFQQRKLSTASGRTLNYNLYQDTAHVLVWGDGTGGSQVVRGKVSGRSVNALERPIYGRILSGQLGSVGIYADAVTVTVIW